jgi:hypothetical protein
MKLGNILVLAAVFSTGVASGAMFLSTDREPCFRNMKESQMPMMFQTLLDGTDGPYGEVLAPLHDTDYVDSYGRRFYVPSYCEVEDTGFMVTIWKK